MIYDSIDEHLPAAGALHRAVLPLAWYLAWCAQHQLLSAEAEQSAGDSLMRLRYREIAPAEFFVPLAAAELKASLLNATGRAFTEAHYPAYLAHLRESLGDSLYLQGDNWAAYAKVSPFLSARLMNASGDQTTRSSIAHGAGRWWKFWK